MRRVIVLLCLMPWFAHAAELAVEDVVVTYDGVEEPYARAMGATLSTARRFYIDQFGFDMPATVRLRIDCGEGRPSRLFTDGSDRVFLSLPSADKLAPPAKSGTFILYGLCHELGHVAMYRTLKQRRWMTSAAAEGWAHYLGSVALDHVHQARGNSLWPQPYNYLADGSVRLRRQLASRQASDVAKAAGQWQTLAKVIDDKAFIDLFHRWQAAEVDPATPGKTLLEALLDVAPDRRSALTAWWKTAQPLFVQGIDKSDREALTIERAKLTGDPAIIRLDDDASDGRRSIAGGGHARLFKSPAGEGWFLTAVSLHGSRYGQADATGESFSITLCDEQMKPIATWTQPYNSIARGEVKWHRIEVTPTSVPKRFHVCFDFDPSATKGVYVSFDTSTSGSSRIATPGKPGTPLDAGDWMIRIELDRYKDADALK